MRGWIFNDSIESPSISPPLNRKTTGSSKNLRHCGYITPHDVAARRNIAGPVVQGIQTGHQLAARWSAYGSRVKVGEAHTLPVQSIEVGRFENRVSVTGEIAVTLIIR